MKQISILILLVAISACSSNTVEKPPKQVEVTLPVHTETNALESVVEVVEETAVETPTVITKQKTPEVEPTLEVKEAPKLAVIEIKVDENPDQFLGAGLGLISERIGAPYFARRDGSIEVWQYHRDWLNGKCHLDLFLYPHTSELGTALKVKYTELRSEFLSKKDQRACFAEMLRDQIRAHGQPIS